MTARALAGDLDLALGSVLDCDYSPNRAAVGDLDLSRDLASALASYHDLLRALASYPVLDRDLAAYFERCRDLALGLADCLDFRPVAPVPADSAGARSTPGRVWLAVLMLPRSWQRRYREEWSAEFAQLCSRKERRDFARGVLAHAWELRRARAGTECPPDHARVEG